MELGSLPPFAYDPAGRKAANSRSANGNQAGKASDSKAASDQSSKLASVREKMKQGFYGKPEVDEAISEKLSGAFDTLA